MTLSSDALTTIAACEEALGIASGAEDTYLTRLIETTSSRIKTYCGRTFYRSDDIEEDVPGYGTSHLLLSRRPIVGAITSITYDTASIDSDSYKILDADAGILYNSTGWILTSSGVNNMTSDAYPGSEDPLYQVTYDGGYVTPNQVDLTTFATRTLPYDLEQACIDFVTWFYRKKGKSPGVTSEKLLSWAVSYGGVNTQGIPDEIAAVLDSYKRPWIG